MIKLLENEFTKIFKRRNIYIILLIVIIIILGYNFLYIIPKGFGTIQEQYKRAYENDILILENYESLNSVEPYDDIVERVELEKYAVENNIKYNILLNSENKNFPIRIDARILLMRFFKDFDIIIIFIVLYISSTIISEEYNTGTIKSLLIRPHKRTNIVISKIITNISIIICMFMAIVIFQYLLGGVLFGFESYELEAIRYNQFSKTIETMNLLKYIIIMIICKFPMYILLSLVSIFWGIVLNNIVLNILISSGIYWVSNLNMLINDISKYIFVFNWDISNNLFNNTSIKQSIIVCCFSSIIIFTMITTLLKNKDILNE